MLLCGPELLTAVVLAITPYFHHVRLLSLFAVLATILAVFFGWAIAGGMRALTFIIVGHNSTPISGKFYLTVKS